MRPVYWGQFALWLPWGLGVWTDYDQQTMFRGMLKKEYMNFKVGDASAVFVPLLAGVLMRLHSDRPIQDDEVLRYDVGNLPNSLLHTATIYFDDAHPMKQGSKELVCQSKALFQWA